MFSSLLFVIKEHFSNLRQVHILAKKEMQKNYKGSLLGLSWAFVRPTLYILIFWFAIQFGLRNGNTDSEIPFIAWLAAGISPWFFISDTLTFAGNAIRGQSYLVTKMKFPISIISTFRVISQWYIHIMFLMIVSLFVILSGIKPSLYWLQIPYFVICTLLFMVVVSWITSTLVVISRDFEQLLRAVASILFWLVPAIWNIHSMPVVAQKIISLNPMVYLIEGYRQTFLGQNWFYEHLGYTVYFWVVLIAIAGLGSYLHVKLRPQFADIL